MEIDKSEHDDFEFKETEHEVTFFGFIKRISCFAHFLRLVIHKYMYRYNEVGSFGRVLCFTCLPFGVCRVMQSYLVGSIFRSIISLMCLTVNVIVFKMVVYFG